MKVLRLIKKNTITIIFTLFIISLIVYANSNINAVEDGLELWSFSVIPTLFPFFIAVELLNHTNLIFFMSKITRKIMRPIFNLPGVASYPLLMGLISGYPMGAKIVVELYERNLCTKEEAERMLQLTNNSGPLFIIGTVGILFFRNKMIGCILLFIHILSSFVVAILAGKNKTKSINNKKDIVKRNKEINIMDLGEVIGDSIQKSIKTILIVGGFVTLFSVIISIFENSGALDLVSNAFYSLFGINKELIKGIACGLLEYTNGLNKISQVHLKSISVNLIVSSFVIGLGGISVMLQILSVISKAKLSGRKYISYKLLQAILASFLTWLIFKIPVFSLDL